jgi:hypothetical protein
MLSRKRRSPVLDLSKEERNRRSQQAIALKSRKQVTQYSNEGKKVRTFESLAEAQKATGIACSSIRDAAAGKIWLSGGFFWRLGKDKKVNAIKEKKQKHAAYVETQGTKVTQFDLNGKMLAQFPSIRDAAQATGTDESSIGHLLKGKNKIANGFYWKKGYINNDIDLSGYLYGRAAVAAANHKVVQQFTLDGVFVKSFPSLKAAAKEMGILPTNISKVVCGKQNTAAGFVWRCE